MKRVSPSSSTKSIGRPRPTPRSRRWRAYFATAPHADAAWAMFFLTGRRLKRLVPSAAIRDWALAATGLPEWMIAECYSVVGDGAETAALVLDQLPSEPAAEICR